MKRLASLSPWGFVEVEEKLHEGALFDVYAVRRDGRRYCLKTPTSGSREGVKEAYLSRATGVETSLWGGDTAQGIRGIEEEAWVLDALLLLEAEKIRATRGAWNHELLTLGVWDGAEDDWKLQEVLTRQRFRHALVMPFHPGTTFDALPVARQRRMWPLMMSAMWRALMEVPHGDLSGSNIILAPDEQRFVLIDPGVALWSRTQGEQELAYMDHAVVLTCNAWHYPLLPPTYRPPRAFGPGATLEHHLQWLALVGERGFLGPVVATSPVVHDADEEQEDALLQELFARDLDPPDPIEGRQPAPADIMALGILYYEVLTGRHPIFAKDDDVAPLWVSSFGEGQQNEAGPYTRFLQQLDEEGGFVPPRAINPNISEEEESLALALLELQTPTLAQLMPHIIAAGHATQHL